MKNLNIYNDIGLNTETQIFDYLLETLKESIFTWDYFVDFKKSITNASSIKNELNLFNPLLNLKAEEFNKEFIQLIRMYPQTRKALPILLAIRANKLSLTQIIDDTETMKSELKTHLFNANIPQSSQMEDELINLIHQSGLFTLFNSGISSLYDYCVGIEVGMDTNARKNRTGTSMENLVEKIISRFCTSNEFKYMSQATSNKLLSEWNVKIQLDKISRRFDFAIKTPSSLHIIEVNYYSGGGSKLKATAGEYKEIENLLQQQGINFIWITDGLGWNTAKTALFETFSHNNYLFNLELLKNGVLSEVIK